MPYLDQYLSSHNPSERAPAAVAFMASLDHLTHDHPEVARAIVQELQDQRSYLKMIASENYSSLAVQLSMGNLLTDKYSEGIVGRGFYAGCGNVDCVESLAKEELKKIFSCDHAYVQPHSGADANLVAFWSILVQCVQNKEVERLQKKTVDTLSQEEYEQVRQIMLRQKMMGLGLNSGGHLTHGYLHNVSAKMMQAVTYEVDPKTELIDYTALSQQVLQEKPLILVAGYSAYPRLIDFEKMREIADSVGAILLSDIAHFSGLVAGKVLTGVYDPVPYSHIVTSTTHKTLRGPRGGMILCKKEFQETIDKGCPLVLGGPLPHVMGAKAIAFKEANTSAFRTYAAQVVANAKILAERLLSHGIKLFTGGTDNHLLVIDVMQSFGLTGRQAETALYDAHITVNRNAIPFDSNGPWYTSGVRIGTPALTSLGMGKEEMHVIADGIVALLKACQPRHVVKTGELSKAKVDVDPQVLEKVKQQVRELLQKFPLYPELTL